jgi:hypothetical protein
MEREVWKFRENMRNSVVIELLKVRSLHPFGSHQLCVVFTPCELLRFDIYGFKVHGQK